MKRFTLFCLTLLIPAFILTGCFGLTSDTYKLDSATDTTTSTDLTSTFDYYTMKLKDNDNFVNKYLQSGETEEVVLEGTYAIDGTSITLDFDNVDTDITGTLDAGTLSYTFGINGLAIYDFVLKIEE